MNIADKIRSARIKKEYTQEQAAEKLLVSRQTISNWENGKSLPDVISIIRMSELYEVSLDELLKGDKVLMEKIEKDARDAKAEKKIIMFAWVAIAAGTAMFILGKVFKGNPLLDFLNGALPWVFLGLMFLFAVTLAGVLSINSMLVNWNSSILGSLTVQIIPVNGVDKLKAKNETLIQEQRAAAMLEAMPEVQKVTPLNDGQLERLLKPWLGDDVDLSNLPMPRLIDVKLKKDAEINFMALAEKLATVAPHKLV